MGPEATGLQKRMACWRARRKIRENGDKNFKEKSSKKKTELKCVCIMRRVAFLRACLKVKW
jgi:hypothetical protein